METPVAAELAEVHFLKEQLLTVFLQVTPACSEVDLLEFVAQMMQESSEIHMGRTLEEQKQTIFTFSNLSTLSHSATRQNCNCNPLLLQTSDIQIHSITSTISLTEKHAQGKIKVSIPRVINQTAAEVQMSISTTPSVLAFSVVLYIMYILSAQVRNKKQTCTVETC